MDVNLKKSSNNADLQMKNSIKFNKIQPICNTVPIRGRTLTLTCRIINVRVA
jgi:hypothetical protein